MQSYCGYSADVQIQLLINGHTFRVAQLGPDFLVLHEAVDHPPASGEMVLQIDGRERRWKVRLPEGLSAGNARVRTSS